MRHVRWARQAIALIASTLATLVAVPAAQAAIVFDGSPGNGAPPATLGGFNMVPAPQDSRPDASTVSDAPATLSSSFAFDQPMMLMTVGSGWCSTNWAGGSYSGRVYYSNGASTVTVTLPATANAFYFYADPDQYGTFTMQATAQDGTSVSSGPLSISNLGCVGNTTPSGQFFGFYGTGGDKIQSVTVSFTDPTAQLTDFALGDFALDSASTPKEPPITASGTSFSATEGRALTAQKVASFSGDSGSLANDYAATIDWGDGSGPSSGTVVANSSGGFDVLGDHTYNEESPTGGYPVKVTITDIDSPSNTATATGAATVADAPLSSSCAAPSTSAKSFSAQTAAFTDGDPGAKAADYQATVDWGDGSSSAGAISGGPGVGPYTVSGSHSYSSTGTFTITTTIADAGGSQSVTSCKVLVYALAPGDGSFVIGDRSSAVGKHVTFWGDQWSKRNVLTGGPAPASFKGFAGQPSVPSCGVSWTANPGDSSAPPRGPLPADMAVIVSSAVTKSGPRIAGNTVHIVVVHTDPGYRPDPGSAGTGTVEAQVC